ncbi:hypothetical protein N692_15100 [Lactiplantibacillus plantarum EGD-AQ4]|nr:hypothetical protein N692_15100 [Lactiplantibacillus plantarum EGD-AQ4]
MPWSGERQISNLAFQQSRLEFKSLLLQATGENFNNFSEVACLITPARKYSYH